MIMATIIKANGMVMQTYPKNGKTFELEELQGVVGGTIEIVHITPRQYMVVNDCGKLHGLSYNPVATAAYCKAADSFADFIVGDVLICDKNQIE